MTQMLKRLRTWLFGNVSMDVHIANGPIMVIVALSDKESFVADAAEICREYRYAKSFGRWWYHHIPPKTKPVHQWVIQVNKQDPSPPGVVLPFEFYSVPEASLDDSLELCKLALSSFYRYDPDGDTKPAKDVGGQW